MKRERRYLKAQKYIVVMWIVAVLGFIAWSTAEACTAYYTSEYTDGMYRICYYSHLGSSIPYAVSVIKTCPLTIQVQH